MRNEERMAPRIRTVESATEQRHGDIDCWNIVTRAADGHGLTHVFPKATLEWRAAEYGIDPGDSGALLDLVLHEQLLEDEEAAAMQQDLSTARSTADARRLHDSRLTALRARTRIVVDGADNPLNAARDAPGITVEGVREKKELVDVHRWRQRYGGLPVDHLISTLPEAPRA